MKRKSTPESSVLSAICDYLAIKRYVFWRQNNMGVYDKAKGAYRTMPKHSVKGVSDIIVLKNGMAYFLECKANTKQSEDQKNFEEMVKKGGAQYFVVRSIDDVQKIGL